MSGKDLSGLLDEVARNFEMAGASRRAEQLRNRIKFLKELAQGEIDRPKKEIQQELETFEQVLTHVRGYRDIHLKHLDRTAWDKLLFGARDALVEFRKAIDL